MRHVRGFSLMEVLAALALLTIVLLGVYSGISTATRIVRSGSTAIERMDEIRSAQTYLRGELAQALVIPFGQNDDGDPLVFAGDDRSFRFVAPMPGYLSRLGPQLHTVSLVDDGQAGLRLEVVLAMLPPDGGEPQPVGEPEVLLRGIRKGAFAYRGLDDQGKPGDWQEQWTDNRRTPSLVRVQLETEGNVAFPALVAPLRIDASASRNGFTLYRSTRKAVQR
ncbi:general secretion pathway protein J [Luteibacter sp. UNCMF331Sha3.1]|uniref:prepilin-type N-terminal cleavage/methylation domain-containing protein n=1 Tax=Luteibacter sp. UNCMF331Sha3.1 TaxID=1502760 RepID=UPI0008CFCDA2|nr:prepilin-type N-terminal cleavage/methylation domain-containing protein [Luteibacter sp. UNCMF331Sha3.1]SEN40528.1 general secretion pathway protein J [Luteibacter sp. UNCMF331Sha3.1]